jgi:hypothetical protein
MFGKQKKRPSIDVNRLTGAAMAAFMTPNGEPESASSRNHRESNGSGAIGTVSAVAIGAALAVTARAAYAKARQKLDLERVADAVEQRLGD